GISAFGGSSPNRRHRATRMHHLQLATRITSWVLCASVASVCAQDIAQCTTIGESCTPVQESVDYGCADASLSGLCSDYKVDGKVCFLFGYVAAAGNACEQAGCRCLVGLCYASGTSDLCVQEEACPEGVDICDDPHMKGLRGQKIDWSGVDGEWYSFIKDDDMDLQVNVRLTAPLPEAFPERQLVTGISVISEGHSLVLEV
ncbi:unnamed protein product, partial [Ectocarpus sp. 12 AP-2014]